MATVFESQELVVRNNVTVVQFDSVAWQMLLSRNGDSVPVALPKDISVVFGRFSLRNTISRNPSDAYSCSLASSVLGLKFASGG